MEAGEAKGRPTPSWVLEEPLLEQGDSFFLHAFGELNSCRTIGFGALGPIPWDKVMLYGVYKSLDKDLLDGFIHIIQQLDLTYLKWLAKKRAD